MKQKASKTEELLEFGILGLDLGETKWVVAEPQHEYQTASV